MREILFRGKQKDNNKWIEGFFYHPTGVWVRAAYKGEPYMIANCENISTSAEVLPETVGQFTGLIDRNRTKIFEGDIVNAKSVATKQEEQYLVRFDDTSLWFGFKGRYSGYVHSLDDLLNKELGYEIEFEVIGNIHDNPELLKDKA